MESINSKMSQETQSSQIAEPQSHHFIISSLEYLLMLLIILEFNTILHELEYVESRLLYGTAAVTVLLCFFRRDQVHWAPVLTLLVIGAFLPFLNVYPGEEKKFIKYFIIIIPLFTLYLKACLRSGVDDMFAPLLKFSNLMVLFAFISLVYWIFASNLSIIQPTIYVPHSWTGNENVIPTFHFIYYETQEATFMGYETVRNSGFFEEGPMYNMVLCTAMAIEIFIRPSISRFRLLVLLITILTTFTTTGFIFITIVIAWVLYKFFGSRFHAILIILAPVLLVGVIMASSFIIEDKRNDKGEGSFESRMRDIENCIEIGIENPILGQGLFTKKLGEVDGGNAAYGYSNSLFAIFADGGIYTVMLYLMCFLVIPLQYFRGESKWPMAMFLFLLLFTFTVSQFKLLTLWFLSIGLAIYHEDELKPINGMKINSERLFGQSDEVYESSF